MGHLNYDKATDKQYNVLTSMAHYNHYYVPDSNSCIQERVNMRICQRNHCIPTLSYLIAPLGAGEKGIQVQSTIQCTKCSYYLPVYVIENVNNNAKSSQLINL